MAVRVTQAAIVSELPSLGTSHLRVTQAALIFEVPIQRMPFTYPITLPAISGIGAQSQTLDIKNVCGETVSPFSLSEQEQLWPGEMWYAEIDLPPMLEAQAEQWVSALTMLYGKFGTFLMGDWNRQTPQGAMSGSPVVNGANSAGSNELNVKGATASVSDWAVAGDYIQITAPSSPQRLYKILQNASTDGTGKTTLPIRPALREALSDGTAIITTNCMGTFRRMTNDCPWKIDKNRVYTISFKAREAQLP